MVLGAAFQGGVCQPEIDAADIDAAGTLTLRIAPFPGDCIALGALVNRVVAVPRRILPARFVFLPAAYHVAHAFVRPDTPPPAQVSAAKPSVVFSPERPSISNPVGTVALPPGGHLTLRKLDDGRPVWVVVRRSGGISGRAREAFALSRTRRRRFESDRGKPSSSERASKRRSRAAPPG